MSFLLVRSPKHGQPEMFMFKSILERQTKFIDMVSDSLNTAYLAIITERVDDFVDEKTFEDIHEYVGSVVKFVTTINPNDRATKKLTINDIEKVKLQIEQKAIADATEAYDTLKKAKKWVNKITGDKYSFKIEI